MSFDMGKHRGELRIHGYFNDDDGVVGQLTSTPDLMEALLWRYKDEALYCDGLEL